MSKKSFYAVWLLVLSLGLSACGKGFDVKTYDFVRGGDVLEKKETPLPKGWEDTGDDFYRVRTQSSPPESIEFTDGDAKIDSGFSMIKGALDIQNLTYQFDKSRKTLTVKGQVQFAAGESKVKYPFDISGPLVGNQIQLVPNEGDSHLRERFKGIATCSDDSCETFYIDFFYMDLENKRIYTDQFIKKVAESEEVETSSPKRKEKEEVQLPEIVVIDTPEDTENQDKTPRKEETSPAKPKVEPKKEPKKNTKWNGKGASGSWEPNEGGASGSWEANPQPKPQPQEKSEPEILVPIKPETPKVDEKDIDEEEMINDAADEDLTQGKAVSYPSPKAEDITTLFPQLRAAKEKAQEQAKEKAEEKNEEPKKQEPKKQEPVTPEPATPEKKQEPVKKVSDFKPLGNWQKGGLSPEAIKVLESIPTGVSQVYEVRKGQRIVRRLERSVNLLPLVEALEPNAGLRMHRLREKAYFGTSELVSAVIRIGQWVIQNVGPVSLDVGDLSDHDGGVQYNSSGRKSHASHQTGIDADIGYIFSETNPGGPMRVAHKAGDKFLLEKQWELFKALFAEGTAHLIYVSPQVKKALCQHAKETGELSNPETAVFTKSILQKIKYSEYSSAAGRMKTVNGHENHFHLRVKCGPDQKFCLSTQAETRPEACPK